MISCVDNMYLFVEKKNGRHYGVIKKGAYVFLQINHRQETQSVSGTGPTGLYYDEMAAIVQGFAAGKPVSVCVLGAGGGTVARRIRELDVAGTIVGIESDRTIIQLGFEFFDLWAFDEVIQADARKFCRFSERIFDVVIDDVFIDSNKKVKVEAESILRKGGILVQNNFPLQGVTATVRT